MAAAQDDRLYRGFGSAPARRVMITASARGAANIARVRSAPVSHQGSPGWLLTRLALWRDWLVARLMGPRIRLSC